MPQADRLARSRGPRDWVIQSPSDIAEKTSQITPGKKRANKNARETIVPRFLPSTLSTDMPYHTKGAAAVVTQSTGRRRGIRCVAQNSPNIRIAPPVRFTVKCRSHWRTMADRASLATGWPALATAGWKGASSSHSLIPKINIDLRTVI
jgi:hypothetical protein